MLILKHLKTLQHVSIIILIIIRELVGSLLKSLNLNFFNFKRSIVVMTFYNSKNFKFSDFNKEPTSYLKMIRIMIETRWSIFKCFNIKILD
jgi:hypothetical protein